jgi:BolA protein
MDWLKNKLQDVFCPTHLDVQDVSHRHAGHAEAKAHGGGHYKVALVSERFEGLTRLQRHCKVNDALESFFKENKIHALKLKLYTPEEWQA